jgi:hypothetical protein
VLAKCGKFFIVFALVLLIGGHWTLLQSVAWVGMTIDNSQALPLKQAIIKTFDGHHPCSLCKFVATGKKSEKKQETQNPTLKVDLFFVNSSIRIYFPGFPAVLTSSDSWTVRSQSPPTPPPLFA